MMKTDDFTKTLKQIRLNRYDMESKVPIDALNKIATDIIVLENNDDFREYAMFVGELSIENPARRFVNNSKAGLYDGFSDKTYRDLMDYVQEISHSWWKDQPDLTLDLDKTYTELMTNLTKASENIRDIMEFFTASDTMETFTDKTDIQ